MPAQEPGDLPASLDEALNLASDPTTTSTSTSNNAPNPSALVPPPPPAQDADTALSDLSKIPLFMTSLDDTTTDPSDPTSNADLEALRALAYEGTRLEVATNFKEQGNDCVKVRKWGDAREFYSQGLGVLRGEVEGQRGELEDGLLDGGGESDRDERKIVDLDEEEERKREEREKERKLEEVLCVNRALCNLELKNYRQTTLDTQHALSLNPNNTKALYRLSLAFFSLTKLPEATSAIDRALALAPDDPAIKSLAAQIRTKTTAAKEATRQRQEREGRLETHRRTLALALKARNVNLEGRIDGAGTDMQDARIQLEDPVDAKSTLVYPVLVLYPMAGQSELLKAVRETETLGLWLSEMLPVPWEAFPAGGMSEAEYARPADVECYMDTVEGGLVKVGKKVLLGEVVGGKGKGVVSDGLVRVYVVPKIRVSEWIAETKKRKGR